MILSHLSPANSDRRASKDKRVLTVTGVVSPQNICSAKAKIGIVNGGGVCSCEDTSTGSSNSNSAFLVAKADREECDNGENESNTMGSCDARSNGSVLSQLARSPEIVNEDQNGCIFCEIIKGRAPAFKLYEDETCLCILDVKPLSHGHSLVIPKSHFPSLEVTPPSVAAAMCAVIPILGSAIMQATRCDSFNLLVNNGAAAGQVIFHTHFHIIPRSMHDKLWRSENVWRRHLCLNRETSLLAECIRGKLSALQT